MPVHAVPVKPSYSLQIGDCVAVIHAWGAREEIQTRPDGAKIVTAFYDDSASGLCIEEETLLFPDSPAVEWVLRLRNNGSELSPALTEINPLDLVLAPCNAPISLTLFNHGGKPVEADFSVHYVLGGLCGELDYQPQRKDFVQNDKAEFVLSGAGGRSSNKHLPFFNLQTAPDAGIIFAVGWSGQWHARFQLDADGALHVRAGREVAGATENSWNVNDKIAGLRESLLADPTLCLLPGEEIRTPRIVMLPWKGELAEGYNLWRRFLRTYHALPLRGSEPLPQTWSNTWFTFNQGYDVNEENQKESMTASAKMGVETLVVDAGWYDCDKNWWNGVGNWDPRSDAFPRSFQPVADHGRKKGIDLGIWFEPERVFKDTELWRRHPQWVLHLPGCDNGLLNLGLPEVQDWFLTLIDRYVAQGMRWFRHDFNINPLPFWQAHDPAGRAGITEIRYIEGLYRIYDEIHRRHPDLIIEGCASGGRRIDLETISRNHGYWATDMMCGTPEPMQAHILGFSYFLPSYLHNTVLQMENAPHEDTPQNRYSFFSFLGGAPVFAFDVRAAEVNYALGKKWLDLFKQIRALTLADFYALTTHTLNHEAWQAMQYNDPQKGEGLVIAFRRPQSPFPLAIVRLYGLQPDKQYCLRELFTGQTVTCSGTDLLREYRIELLNRPDVALWHYVQVVKS